jgi:signal transduction histidine kinase
MVWNLVDNAVRHNEPGGWIRVTTGVVSTGSVPAGAVSIGAGPEQVFLRVANSGSAVPAGSVPAIFEPFRRLAGRTGGQDGVGLGLSIVRSVAAAHDARLDARPVDGGGLEVFVALRAAGLDGPPRREERGAPAAASWAARSDDGLSISVSLPPAGS